MNQPMSITDFIAGLKTYSRGISIIYAEDEPEVRGQVDTFLHKFFEDIRVCSDGQVAFDEYQARLCDILITDIAMPNMDGIELSTKISEANQEQKIIVISAHNDSDRLMKLINIGVEKFLLKPFDNRMFLRMLYTTCRDIYTQKEKLKLEISLKESLHKTQAIINAVDSALIIVENGQITNANRRFLELVSEPNIEEFNTKSGRIDALFVPAKGYALRADNAELIKLLKEQGSIKVVVKNADGMVIMLASLSTLNENSELIVLTDVTGIEKDLLNSKQKLLTNPFTGLPNKTALHDKVFDLISKYSVTLVLFSIMDYQKSQKWLGRKRAVEAEKFVADSVKGLMESNKLPLLFMSNYDQNKFAILSNKNDAKLLNSLIDKKELSFSYGYDKDGPALDSTLLKLNSTVLTIEKDIGEADAIVKIEKSFDTLG